MPKVKKFLALQCAALGEQQIAQFSRLAFNPIEPISPGLTCPVQATMRTARAPSEHGMRTNGTYIPSLDKILFWEQSANQVQGQRIWEGTNLRVGMFFWQQSLGEHVDWVLSPKPIHKHSGGMIQDCYSQPEALYRELCQEIGKPFSLFHYWGPLAGKKSSEWITRALCSLLKRPDCPELCFAYLPHLDYDLQRFGPDHPKAQLAVLQLEHYLLQLQKTCQEHGYELIVYGDYAMHQTKGHLFPNDILFREGLFRTRNIKGMAYPDFFNSRAFAMVDHEIAHILIKHPDERTLTHIKNLFTAWPGLDRIEETSNGLMLWGKPGYWFAYPWWSNPKHAPDFARHVDIHNKPGFDPCELFWGWPPGSVSMNPEKVGGTHGNGGRVAWYSTCSFSKTPNSLLELSTCLREEIHGTH